MKQNYLIRLAIADDHSMFREAISIIIDSWENCKVVIQAENGRQLLDKLDPELPPDLVIVDLHMPVLNGYETITTLRQKYPLINILAISVYQSEEMIWQLIECGAQGFINKTDDILKLKKAVYEVMHSGYFFADHTASRMVKKSIDTGSIFLSNVLDAKETAFLKKVCSEKTYKEISFELGIPERKTEYLRNRLFERFGVKSRTGPALYATQKGIIFN